MAAVSGGTKSLHPTHTRARTHVRRLLLLLLSEGKEVTKLSRS